MAWFRSPQPFLGSAPSGQIITWVGGPSRALLQTAENGEIPPWFAATNGSGAPKVILIIQAIIVSVLGAFYLIFPNPSAAFYLLSAMTVALYLVMYLLMYAAAIKLRYSHPDVPRHFRVPGGNLGMWMIAGGGFLAAAFALIVSFFPPTQSRCGFTNTLHKHGRARLDHIRRSTVRNSRPQEA